MVRLCFLQERRYAPYAKWLGAAFGRLDAASAIAGPPLEALSAPSHRVREDALARVLEAAARHNALGVTAPLDPSTGPFDVRIDGAVRPQRVPNAARFAEACREALPPDSPLRRLGTTGSVDQLTGATDEMVHFSDWPRRLEAVYEEKLRRPDG